MRDVSLITVTLYGDCCGVYPDDPLTQRRAAKQYAERARSALDWAYPGTTINVQVLHEQLGTAPELEVVLRARPEAHDLTEAEEVAAVRVDIKDILEDAHERWVTGAS